MLLQIMGIFMFMKLLSVGFQFTNHIKLTEQSFKLSYALNRLKTSRSVRSLTLPIKCNFNVEALK